MNPTLARSPWDFSEALEILHSPSHEKSSLLDVKNIRPTAPRRSSRLGDFSKLWQDLGVSQDALDKTRDNSDAPKTRGIDIKDHATDENTTVGATSPPNHVPDPNRPLAPPLRDDVYASDGGYHEATNKNVTWKDQPDYVEATDDAPTTPTTEEDSTPMHLTELFKSDEDKEWTSLFLSRKERKRLKKQRQKARKRIEQERTEHTKAKATRKVLSDVESESEVKRLPKPTPASKASLHIVSAPTTTRVTQTQASRPNETAEYRTTEHEASGSQRGPEYTTTVHSPRISKYLQLTPSKSGSKFVDNLLPTSVSQAKLSTAQELSRKLQSQFSPSLPVHIPIVTMPAKQQKSKQQVAPSPNTNGHEPSRSDVISSYSLKRCAKEPNQATAQNTTAPGTYLPSANSAVPAKPAVPWAVTSNARSSPIYTANYTFSQHCSVSMLTSIPSLPFEIYEKEDRDLHLLLRLVHDFPEDKKWLTKPVPMADHTSAPEGIHVFVDFSNIWIGFMDHLKNIQHMHPRQRIPHRNISFDALVLLLERKRPVSKRVLAGSYPLLPAMELAKQIGYETLILEKVYKSREPTERQRRILAMQAKNSFAALGTQSDGNTSSSPPQQATPIAVNPEKWVEQGVDEILHLKILESIVDSDTPSRMVIATGDAAQAEYSEGFKKMIVRALKKGWMVELVAFSKSISAEYWKGSFQSEWEDAFSIVCLDGFAQFLLDT